METFFMPRRNRWLYLLLLLVAAVGLWISWTAWRHAANLQALRAEGYPVTLADLKPNPVANDHNAAMALQDAAADWKIFNQQYGEFVDTELGKAFEQRQQAKQLPTEEQLLAIADLLAASDEVIASADEAARRPLYSPILPEAAYSDIDLLFNTSIEMLGNVKQLAYLNNLRFDQAIAEQRFEEAVQIATATLRIGKLAEGEYFLIGYLMASAVKRKGIDLSQRLLNSEERLEDSTVRRLDAALAALDDRNGFRAKLAEECVLSQELISTMPWPISLTEGPQMARFFANELKLCDVPTEEVAKELASTTQKPSSLFSVFESSSKSAIDTARGACLRTIAQSRCLRVLLAIKQQGLPAGAQPTANSLSLPEQALIDPHTGQPLTIEQTESDGKTYWSVSSKVYTAGASAF
jgi:hypothetical protein